MWRGVREGAMAKLEWGTGRVEQKEPDGADSQQEEQVQQREEGEKTRKRKVGVGTYGIRTERMASAMKRFPDSRRSIAKQIGSSRSNFFAKLPAVSAPKHKNIGAGARLERNPRPKFLGAKENRP